MSEHDPVRCLTFFTDRFAYEKREDQFSLDVLLNIITGPVAATKNDLPLLSLQGFGELRSRKGALRHDANVWHSWGVVGDYDGEKLAIEEAVEKLNRAMVEAVIYSSPSYTPQKPRWRVLAWYSETQPTVIHAAMTARLNGALGGVLGSESFALSQGFFYGRVEGGHPVLTALSEGGPIDLVDDLDETAIGKPVGARPPAPGAPPGASDGSDNSRSARTVRAALALFAESKVDSYAEMVAALRQHADAGVREYVEESEAANDGERQLVRIYERFLADKVAERARALEALDAVPGPDPPEPEPELPRKSRIITGDEFVAAFEPPDCLIGGIIQKGRLYACTSITAHGKTAVWLYFACMVHSGRMAGGLETEPGAVLYLAGENPQDLQARMLGMGQRYSIPSLQLPYVLPAAFPLEGGEAEHLKSEIRDLEVPLALIVGDTAAAFFPGDDENDNVIARDYARTLRSFTELPGRPAIVVLAHPVKNANHDTLLPRGGGAFLNELDGNLTLWSPELGERTTLHWQGKIRGPDFDPVTFRLIPQWTGARDKKNRDVMTIVARPMDDAEAADQSTQTIANEDYVLRAHFHHPKASLAEIARILGWSNDAGEPSKAKVQRAVKTLAAAKLLAQPAQGRPYKITDRGTAYLREEGLIPNDQH